MVVHVEHGNTLLKKDGINMINIKYSKDYIKITGHSSNEVCAAISSITYTGVNFMSKYNDSYIDFTDDGVNMEIKILKHDNIIDDIFNTMIQMYQDVIEQVPEDCVSLENVL